jgi:hypothetical protein
MELRKISLQLGYNKAVFMTDGAIYKQTTSFYAFRYKPASQNITHISRLSTQNTSQNFFISLAALKKLLFYVQTKIEKFFSFAFSVLYHTQYEMENRFD